ncbi:MAG: hypothetical protein J2P36_28780 [Ktedonobacteraceae bacterium]|nr:hypothetical protein [Ktedonobacteraceae bacterium]
MVIDFALSFLLVVERVSGVRRGGPTGGEPAIRELAIRAPPATRKGWPYISRS